MRYLSLFIVVSLALTFCINDVFAQSSETEALKNKVEMFEKELKEIKDLLKQQIVKDEQKEKEIVALKARDDQKEKEIASIKEEVKKKEMKAAALTPGEESYFARKSAEFEEKKLGSAFATPSTKPFLRRFGRNTYLGGYMDFEFRAFENDDEGRKDRKEGFQQHRLVPFIYSDVSDRVKFATEIEIEYGGPDSPNPDNVGGSKGELKVEFATIDFLIRDEINLRAGIILDPLGKFNLMHDPPLQDLTDRPLVDQFIIPTAFRESGAGLFGTFYPTGISKLDYEIYAVNGFTGIDREGKAKFSTSTGLRGGMGNPRFDFNGEPAVVGRVGFSPFLGLEFGGSCHYGSYDVRNNNQLAIVAGDFAYQYGAFEIVGEYANAFIERDGTVSTISTSTGAVSGMTTEVRDIIPDDFWGYYIEPRYHFMPGFLKTMAPTIFTEDSTFTAVTRWEQLDLDGFLRNRATFGLNYRYTEDTVFKLDYQLNGEHGKQSPSIANNAFLFSITSYF